MGLRGDQIAIVTDIGCCGLFDVFFNTHAFHGLHGRALTYAAGIKLARPNLHVVVVMGDGGLGIGGAHFLAACRRNLDLTLLILNNFNFGMTGGQFSVTTLESARVASGFLNRLERPMDVCLLARSAGAPCVFRCSAHESALADHIERALRFKGFAVLDLWGICPGRYGRLNRLTTRDIEKTLSMLPAARGVVAENEREEFGTYYRELASKERKADWPRKIESTYAASKKDRQEVILLGNAGQRVITTGEILCFAAMTAGLNVAQKNEYAITVLRGPSISEVILSQDPIGYSGIEKPDAVLAVGQEGVDRRAKIFEHLDSMALVIQAPGVKIPDSNAHVIQVDFRTQGFKRQDWALASLALLAKTSRLVTKDMLRDALAARFSGAVLESSIAIVEKAISGG